MLVVVSAAGLYSLQQWRRAERAQQLEAEQRRIAEANLSEAIDTLDRFLVALGEEDLRDLPAIEALRLTWAQSAVERYARFADQRPDPIVLTGLSRAETLLASAIADVGSINEALVYAERSIEVHLKVHGLETPSASSLEMFFEVCGRAQDRARGLRRIDRVVQLAELAWPFAELGTTRQGAQYFAKLMGVGRRPPGRAWPVPGGHPVDAAWAGCSASVL